MLEASELDWARAEIPTRVSIIARFRQNLLLKRDSILEALGPLRPHSNRGELLASELIPLLDACRFLEQQASRILAPKRLTRKGQPIWLWGIENTIHREALGRILILAPSNYPLFLPIVQALHAWTAGNSVWLKSAPGSLPLHNLLQQIFRDSGGSDTLFMLLGEAQECLPENLSKVHKVILIGSAQAGIEVGRLAAEALIPFTAELSGWDSVFIHPEADMEKAARAVAFGLSLNQGRTCVAPRRIFLRSSPENFERHFSEAIKERPSSPLNHNEQKLVTRECALGAQPISASPGHGPVLLSRIHSKSDLLLEETFGALAILCVTESDEDALQQAQRCSYALGASLFGPEAWCRELAHRLPAQVVSINDIVVPSADPRLPFGGSGKSGFGRMRGAEGLLEMTQTRTVSVRQGGSLDHLSPPNPINDLIVEQFMLCSHESSLFGKSRAMLKLVLQIARERIRKKRERIENAKEY